MTLNPINEKHQIFAFDSFGFGRYYGSGIQYYIDIGTSNTTSFEAQANTLAFSMNLRGIGLPPNQFLQFSNLLNIATQNNATCNNTYNGIHIAR
jgi:hypothetical protein